MSLAIVASDDSEVVVSGTVVPYIQADLSATTCALGNIPSATSVASCAYSMTVSTNADNGYENMVKEVTDGTNTDLNLETDADVTISDEDGDSAVTAGTEEYGAGTPTAGQDLALNTDCDGTPLTTSPAAADDLTSSYQIWHNASGPVSSEATFLCHYASADAATEAGNYDHTVRHYAVGSF